MLSSLIGFDLGGVVRTPTDSQPMAETETEGTISTSHESGIAIATPPEVESPVFLSDRMIEKPRRENSISLCNLVSFSIRTIAL